MSSKITTSTDSTGKVTAVATPATIGDIFSTAISTNEAVTGMYGLGQKAMFVAAGMMIHSYRKQGTVNFLG